MRWTKRLWQAFRHTNTQRPRPGRVIAPRPEDSIRDYPGAGLTPARLMSVLREADAGDLAAPMQLFEEMEEKDAHLYAVANTRRLGLTGLDWEVVSAADRVDGVNRSAANEAADYARQVLASMDSFDDALQHLALATGRNIAIAEIIWEVVDGELRPVELVPVDFTRIVFDDLDRPRILTGDAPRDGIPLPPHKFIVHTPQNVTGHPQRGGLLRVSAMVYLAKNMALKDWMIFAEIFGMPLRVARYEPNATAEEKRELMNMLESLGSNAAGIFSRAVELQIIESRRDNAQSPYQNLIEFLNREMSKAWLGQTLTTDTAGQSGTFAASRVHEMVRRDVLADDIRKEGRTIRRDLLSSITRLRFGPNVPVPYFHRRTRPTDDLEKRARTVDLAVNRLGARVPAGWLHETLDIPRASDSEPTLPGVRG